MTSNTFP